MKKFKNWLIKKGYRKATIQTYTNQLKHFKDWCEQNDVKPNAANLNQLYEYQKHIMDKGYAITTLLEKIRIISFYYQCIGRKTNPVLFMKKVKTEKTLPKDQLDSETLSEIYLSLTGKPMLQVRNKCMLGLVVFQALKREELEQLEVHHIEIENNRLYVPSTARTNSRYIDLRPFQVQELEKYLYEYRPMLLKEAKKETSRLFFSQGKSGNLNGIIMLMLRKLKVDKPYFKSLIQLRESRISLWVKAYGIRKTQYLSGMRYATSVLRYKQTDTESLRMKVNVIHPMERMGI